MRTQTSVILQEEDGICQCRWIIRRYPEPDVFPLNDLTRLALRCCQQDGKPHAHRFKNLRWNDRRECWRVLQVNERHIARTPEGRHHLLGLRWHEYDIPQSPPTRLVNELLPL